MAFKIYLRYFKIISGLKWQWFSMKLSYLKWVIWCMVCWAWQPWPTCLRSARWCQPDLLQLGLRGTRGETTGHHWPAAWHWAGCFAPSPHWEIGQIATISTGRTRLGGPGPLGPIAIVLADHKKYCTPFHPMLFKSCFLTVLGINPKVLECIGQTSLTTAG